MKKFVIALSFIGCIPAWADQFYVAAGFECNARASELRVWFKGEWNEAGVAMLANLDHRAIDPQKLIQIRKDSHGIYSIKMRSMNRKCVLNGQTYMVDMAPLLAQQYQPEGFCAARIGASVKVSQHGKTVVERGVDACNETGLVTTQIRIRPDALPVFKEVPASAFYAGHN